MKVIVPVSGGKDSQACLKLAVTDHGSKNVTGLFCDTKFEHPKTYQHIDYLRALYNVSIETINAGSVSDEVRKYKRFPGGGARHCTKHLKIRPSKKWYKTHAEAYGGFHVWIGVRSN